MHVASLAQKIGIRTNVPICHYTRIAPVVNRTDFANRATLLDAGIRALYAGRRGYTRGGRKKETPFF